MVFALQILRDFAAEKPASDRVIGVAAELDTAAVIDGDQDGTGVRAIERADRMTDFHIRSLP